MIRPLAFSLAALMVLGACQEEEAAVPPAAVAMTEDALGHYCQMNLSEHPGPKAQVHLEGMPAPLFFAQVRDAIAYQRMPEQTDRILAIYVSDMGAAPSWADPGIDNWIVADTAIYVTGAETPGGMGAPELVPFADTAAANAFVAQNGGTLTSLDLIADEQVLAPVEFVTDADGNFLPPDTEIELKETH